MKYLSRLPPLPHLALRGLTLLVFFIGATMARASDNIKKPNVAGQFYNAASAQLSSEIDDYLSRAEVKPYSQNIQLLIAPHAGYMYSAPVAAYAYKAASQGQYQTIIVIAPSHHFGYEGISIGLFDGYETPLGVVKIDADLAQKLIDENEAFAFMPKVFEREHALEVQLPFIQKVFTNAKIIPVIVGQPDLNRLDSFAKILAKQIGTRSDVLIVLSTDMSHYHPSDIAGEMDQATIAAVKKLDVKTLWQGCVTKKLELCGFMPVTIGLLYAHYQGIDKVDVLKYADSGDVTGDKSQVVGYMAAVFYREEEIPKSMANENVMKKIETVKALSQMQKKRLLEIARSTMEEYIRSGKILEFQEADSRLAETEGAFVTIHKKGQLRGCIGNIIGQGPLYKTVRDMAIASSSEDPRFDKVTKEELKDLEVEISVLSKPYQIKNVDEIQLGKHGVIVRKGFRQGVFLPQVATETGWSKEEFLAQLCSQKAGLDSNAWKDAQTVLEIFTADVFSEKEINK